MIRLLRTFHVKHLRPPLAPRSGERGQGGEGSRRRSAALAAFALASALLLTASACSGVDTPDGWAAPVASGDILLMHDGEGTITALRLTGDTASLLWSYPRSDDDRDEFKGFYATPVIDTSGAQPRVYLAAYSGDLIALDLQTGTPAAGWPGTADVGGRVVATPGFDGKTLYVANHRGNLRPVDAATGAIGSPLVHTKDRVWGQPLAVGGRIVFTALDRSVRAIDPAGSTQWRRQLAGAVAGDPAIDDDMLVVGTLDSRLYALDLTAEGATSWTFDGDHWFWARPLITDDTVYAISVAGTLYAIDRATGAQRWRLSGLGDEVRAGLALVQDTIVVATRNDGFIGVDPAGRERWRQRTEGAHFLANPLVLESAIFYSSHDGTLYRVKPAGQGTIEQLYKRG